MIKNLVKKKTKEEEPKPEWYHEHMKKVVTEKKIKQDEEDKKAFLKNARAWIDEIDDPDQFIDQLLEVNESCTSSPSLDAYCASFKLKL